MLQGYDIENTIEAYGDPEVTWTQQGMLRLQPRAWFKLFHASIEQIKSAVRQAIINPFTHGEGSSFFVRFVVGFLSFIFQFLSLVFQFSQFFLSSQF